MKTKLHCFTNALGVYIETEIGEDMTADEIKAVEAAYDDVCTSELRCSDGVKSLITALSGE